MGELGKEQNPSQAGKFVNHEGLKRVYKPRAQREAEEQLSQTQAPTTEMACQANTLFVEVTDANIQAQEDRPSKVANVQTSDHQYSKTRQSQISGPLADGRPPRHVPTSGSKTSKTVGFQAHQAIADGRFPDKSTDSDRGYGLFKQLRSEMKELRDQMTVLNINTEKLLIEKRLV